MEKEKLKYITLYTCRSSCKHRCTQEWLTMHGCYNYEMVNKSIEKAYFMGYDDCWKEVDKKFDEIINILKIKK